MRKKKSVRRIEKRMWKMRLVGEKIEERRRNSKVIKGLRKRIIIKEREQKDIDEKELRKK